MTRLHPSRTPALALLACAAGLAAPAAGPEGQPEALRRAEQLSAQSQWPEAAAAWQRVVESNPHLGRAWMSLGTARYNARDYRAAIPAYARALELGATYPSRPAYQIACCHARLGEAEQALEWLRKALDRGFRSLEQVQKEEAFAPLRDDERFRQLAALVDVSRLSRDEGWRFDLDLLAREVKRTHHDPFKHVSREEFDAEVRRLHDDIPKLTRNEITVGFRKLLRRLGDGHTGLSGRRPGEGPKDRAPVAFYLFAEGLFITDADPRFADLAGAQVLRVGGHSVEEALRALDAVVPQDNRMTLLWHAPAFLRAPEILNGQGLIPDDKSLPLTVRDAAGKERDVSLPADTLEPGPDWVSARKGAAAPEPLYLRRRGDPYWFEDLPAEKTVYCQYNQVGEDGQKETIEQFSGRLFRFVEGHDVDKLVVDMRWNGGGNNFLNEPLVNGLVECRKVNRPGHLFVIVGRNTFSAAMCAAAQIDWHTKAVFVGEPTGSSPNFVGESAVRVYLPYSKLRASVSDLYWENSVAMDFRTWIAPQIYAPPTFAAFRANRDPALEAILAYREPEAPARPGRAAAAPASRAAAGPGAAAGAAEPSYRITTVAGNGERGFAGDGGPAAAAKLARPCAVDVDEQGNLFIADYHNARIRKVAPDGTITTLAGTGEPGYAGDGGPAVRAKLWGPYGVRADRHGNVFIADQRNHRVRKVAPDGTITTVAGDGRRGGDGDGGPAIRASLSGPNDMVADGEGNLYIADAGNSRVRRVAPDGTITTVAGTGRVRYNGESGYDGDGGPATLARLSHPSSLALDAEGNLYIGDFGNHAVRKVAKDGVITTVAGTGRRGFNGDRLPATLAQLNEPGGAAVTPDGSLLIADGVNGRVRRVNREGLIETVAGTGRRGYSGDGGPAAAADLSVLDILCVDRGGNVYVADHSNCRIRKLTPEPAAPPPADEAGRLLSDMRAAYRGVRAARAEFTFRRRGIPGGGPATGALEFMAPARLRAEVRVPGYEPVTVYCDGVRITTLDPAERRPDVRDYSPDALLRAVPGNLEVACLFDWGRQLWAGEGGNMRGSRLRVLRGEPWDGREWTVLEEATDGPVIRYYVDPKTHLIGRTESRDPRTGEVTFDGWLTKLEPGAPVDPARFEPPGR
jgi:tetratricopeptide (TPR) repeat protein/sugar lactone lactonase YvrE